MSVNAVDNQINYIRDTSNDSRSSMVNSDTFLKLLVAQMKYQDPLSPQDNTQFVAQLAQMSTMQEMQNMSASLKNSQAYDMIGKEIYAEVLNTETNETNAYFGVVDSVVIKEGVPYVVVGNTMISISNVLRVFNPQAVSDETETDSTSETTPETTPENQTVPGASEETDTL